jgi:hypothetical protein
MDLEPRVLETMLSKLSTDLSSTGFITPPAHCMDKAARSLLLKAMPTLDGINIDDSHWDIFHDCH